MQALSQLPLLVLKQSSAEFELYPQPSLEVIYMKWNDRKAEVAGNSIMDAKGQLIRYQSYEEVQKVAPIPIEIKDLSTV